MGKMFGQLVNVDIFLLNLQTKNKLEVLLIICTLLDLKNIHKLYIAPYKSFMDSHYTVSGMSLAPSPHVCTENPHAVAFCLIIV